MNVIFYLSYDIKITLKSHFWRKKLRLKVCYYESDIVMDAISLRYQNLVNLFNTIQLLTIAALDMM